MEEKPDDFYTVEEYEELMAWTKNLEEAKEYLENENKKLKEWTVELERTKAEFLKQIQEKDAKLTEMELHFNENNEKTFELKQTISELENDKSKLTYKINRYLSNPKIKKIVDAKKLDQY